MHGTLKYTHFSWDTVHWHGHFQNIRNQLNPCVSCVLIFIDKPSDQARTATITIVFLEWEFTDLPILYNAQVTCHNMTRWSIEKGRVSAFTWQISSTNEKVYVRNYIFILSMHVGTAETLCNDDNRFTISIPLLWKGTLRNPRLLLVSSDWYLKLTYAPWNFIL